MPATRYETAGSLINRVAVAVGLNQAADPFASPDPSFVQLRTLAVEVGQTLVQDHNWQKLTLRHTFTTAPGDTGIYDLPADFSSMIDQTGWQQGTPGAAYPLLGPATPQWWSYLEASQIYTVTIYAWFRVKEGRLELYPQPPPSGIPIAYEYQSRAWVIEGTSPPGAPVYSDTLAQASDQVLFEPILFVKALKLAFLQAKGFDTTKAQDEYQASYAAWSSKDSPAPVLNLAGRSQVGYRMLDSIVNVPETGFG